MAWWLPKTGQHPRFRGRVRPWPASRIRSRSAGIPSPVNAEVRNNRPHPQHLLPMSRPFPQIALVHSHHRGARPSTAFSSRCSSSLRSAWRPAPPAPARRRPTLHAAGNASSRASSKLSRSPAVSTNSSGIPSREFRSVTVSAVVAASPSTIRPLALHQPIEQRALSCIRPPHDRQRQAIVHNPAHGQNEASRAVSGGVNSPIRRAIFGLRRHVHVILGKVDARLEQRNQLHPTPCFTGPTRRLSAPPIWLAAWRTCEASAPRIRSRTASACVRSIFPARKAR